MITIIGVEFCAWKDLRGNNIRKQELCWPFKGDKRVDLQGDTSSQMHFVIISILYSFFFIKYWLQLVRIYKIFKANEMEWDQI